MNFISSTTHTLHLPANDLNVPLLGKLEGVLLDQPRGYVGHNGLLSILGDETQASSGEDIHGGNGVLCCWDVLLGGGGEGGGLLL